MTQKTILLATLGKFPQIITETLYAIHQEGFEWPAEVIIITNKECKDIAIKALLENSLLENMCRDIGKPVIKHEDVSFLTITEHDNFEDFISVENEIENFIMDAVRALTEDAEQQIHAVYTGGIKTMSTILCRAMDFYGRPFDRLSSIFVSKDFQRCDSFYYPKDQVIDVGAGTLLNAKNATITLRTTRPLPHKGKLNLKKSSAFDTFSYAELIKFLEYSSSPEEIKIEIIENQFNPCINVLWGDIFLKKISFAKGERRGLFCFYAIMAEGYVKNEEINRPIKIDPKKHSQTHIDNARIAAQKVFKLFTNKLMTIEGTKDFREALKDSSADSIQNEEFHAGAFDTYLNNVKSHIQRYIPPYFSIFIEPTQRSSKKLGYEILIPRKNISFHRLED